MNNKSEQSKSKHYTRYLKLVEAIRGFANFPALDPVEERLLNQLAALWDAGTKVTIMEALRMSPDVSERTVHRRLKTLNDKGWISFMDDAHDERIRYITTTPQTEQYFASMGNCLDLAAKS